MAHTIDCGDTMTAEFQITELGERYLYALNRHTFLESDSTTVFERRIALDFQAKDTLFVVIGSDSGLLLRYLHSQTLGDGSRIVLLEDAAYHDTIATECADLQPRSDILLCSSTNWEQALQLSEVNKYAYGGKTLVVEALCCKTDYAGCYLPLLREVLAGLNDHMQEYRSRVHTKLFIERQLQNVTENITPAAMFRGIGQGHTAVVLGGGPSLEADIEWIQQNRDKLFILAVSRLCGKLQDIALTPDVVVSVDPEDGMFDVSKEGLYWQDIPLVGSYHLAPQLLHQWNGPRLYMGQTLPWDDGTGNKQMNIQSMGPTVSHAAAWLAYQWGFSRILLSGVDLCYAIDGNTHVAGTAEDVINCLPSHCDATVTTYSGRLAGTSVVLKQGLAALQNIGETVNQRDAVLFNLSPDAASVDSIPLIDKASLVSAQPAPRLPITSDLMHHPQQLEALRPPLHTARRHFAQIIDCCNKANQCLARMYGPNGAALFDKHKRKLDSIERQLLKSHTPYFPTLKHYATADFTSMVRPSGFANMADAELEAWGRDYYGIIKRCAKRFLQLIDAALVRTDKRLMEHATTLNADALLDYWNEDATPGRVLHLQERLLASTTAETATRVHAAVESFAQLLGNDDTDYARSLIASTFDHGSILRTIAFLVQQEALEDLGTLAERLVQLDSSHSLLGLYAKGCLAELETNVNRALDLYQLVLDEFNALLDSDDGIPDHLTRLLEDVLLRINHVYLADNNGEAALASLELLAQLSATYAPRYAALLSLLQRHQEALDVLNLFIQAVPDDWRAVQQLADIYTRVGAGESAYMAQQLSDAIRNQPADSLRAA